MGIKGKRNAAVDKRPLRLEWMPAADLNEHPDNWRLHPGGQMVALQTFMDDVGWAGALLYNERTRHLLDGHARRALFAERDGDVPVLIGNWSEDDERKIIALLDPVGGMAESDSDRLLKLLGDPTTLTDELRAAVAPALEGWTQTTVPVVSLKPHPKNYRKHPTEQIDHLIRHIEQNGFYRPLVVARDNTILAGHGAWMAASKMGMTLVPAVRLNIDPLDDRAVKLVVADNEIPNLADWNDRERADMLRDIMERGDLLGTGFDEKALANLIYVTRPQNEIQDHDAAAEWVGMPEFDPGRDPIVLTVRFLNEEDREEFVKRNGLPVRKFKKYGRAWSAWWPPDAAAKSGLDSLRWEEGDE